MGVPWLLRPFIWERSLETTFFWDLFILDHIHMRLFHLRSHSFETYSFETTFIWRFFIWDDIHLSPHSFETYLFETTFIWDHIYLSPHSYETTFIVTRIIWDTHSFETTYILRLVKVKLFSFTVNHIFMMDLSFLCGRPEVLQGDYSFEVLQCYALPCPEVTHVGCKCTHHLKHRGGQKTLHTSGLEANVAHVKYHLDQCFSNFFIPSPPFHSRHIVLAPKPHKTNIR